MLTGGPKKQGTQESEFSPVHKHPQWTTWDHLSILTSRMPTLKSESTHSLQNELKDILGEEMSVVVSNPHSLCSMMEKLHATYEERKHTKPVTVY